MVNSSNLPDRIGRFYDSLNKSVVDWRYATECGDRIIVNLEGEPRTTVVWEHNGMVWHPVKSINE